MQSVKIEMRRMGSVDFIGMQPPLEDVDDSLYDDMQKIETPHGTVADDLFTVRTDVGGNYSELTLGGDVLNPASDEQTRKTVEAMASILMTKGYDVFISESIEPIEAGDYMFGCRRFTERERLLDTFGISPAAARAYLMDRFKVTPEDIRATGETRHGSHDIEAYTRIALAEDAKYLFEEVFWQVRKEVDEETEANGEWVVIDAYTTTNMRRDEFRHDSLGINKKYMTQPEK
jgi:hypothetical protein